MAKIKVPDAILKAAIAAFYKEKKIEAALEAALRCMAENPIVPTLEDVENILAERVVETGFIDANYLAIYVASQWQRHMFFAPDPKVPPELIDILNGVTGDNPGACITFNGRTFSEGVIEAFRRSKESR